MKLYLLLTLFIVFTSCLPNQGVQETTTQNNNTSNNDSTDDGIDFSPDNGGDSTSFPSDAQWSNSGLISQTVTLDFNNKKTVYLVGDDVHNFLTQNDAEYMQKTFCIEVYFNSDNLTKPKRLRVKALPALSNRFTANKITRYLRVNLSTDSGNDICNIDKKDTSGNTFDPDDSDLNGVVNADDVGIANYTDVVCPTCLNILGSKSLTFYTYKNASTALEPLNSISHFAFDKLSLRIDLNSNSGNTVGSCSDSNCKANGFDCCVEGQCVNEQSIKISGVQADPNGFLSAEQEKTTNPTWFKKYPQYYYICLEQTPSDDTGSGSDLDPEEPEEEADARLSELVNDYECVEELITNSQTDPFHRNPIDNSKSYSECLVNDITEVDEFLYYKNVMKRLYVNCGCSEKDNLDIMIDTCPAYTYDVIFKTDNFGQETTEISSVVCVTPEVEQTPLPFSDLDVTLNSRSAPHRFFDDLNFEINPDEDMPAGASGVQEGEEFKYLDSSKVFPFNSSNKGYQGFNMNSILGQMTTSLDKARPAKTIDVEFDKMYLVSTLSGLYSPCPNCAKDSWFQNFTSNAPANRGVGLQAVNFTTRRDTYGTNLTLGNYEDTIFGRACWLPPTMIPFSHSEDTSAQQQRLDRLETQAAFYMNGYQRDWFGFNKGALIGSFDGVTWFAVGKGRIVQSTSDKLFLAINAPFADLASPTDHIVSIQEYDFVSNAPSMDYDPELEINHPNQNAAASCQEYHECETDSHCITKLGWEYVCADVSNIQTKWPTFEPIGAIEIANSSTTGAISEFLQQSSLPPSLDSKRCVYRGAGAPCRKDYESISDEGIRKTLTCAPNFYCESLDASNKFNKEIARFAASLSEVVESKNHLYGQDANIIGRPKDYVAGTNLTTLPNSAKTAIDENILLTDTGATGQTGICRPGKLLPSYASDTDTNNWEPSNQHQSADSQSRTDYISQIGSCNSALYTDLRYSSCPMLDEDGNYIHTQSDFIDSLFDIPEIGDDQVPQVVVERYSIAQNACGLESLDASAPALTSSITSDALTNFSAFKTIEGRSLSSSDTIVEETLVRDACFRKAGAVCHTDLDCSPNKLMAQKIDLVASSFFGNEAEKTYYEEYLVCGQAEVEPVNSSALNFNTYTLHNNRCCREVGKDITMLTEDSPANVDFDLPDGLETNRFGAFNPSSTTRYSRYSIVDSVIDSVTKLSNIIRPSANTDTAETANITVNNQWKTINNAASRTCCGGGWVRKFADGTNNWQIQRLNLDIENFECLNIRSPLLLTENPEDYDTSLSEAQMSKDRLDYCTDPTFNRGGCIEQSIGDINDFSISKPVINILNATMTIDSDEDVMEALWGQNPWAFRKLIPTDTDATDENDRNLIMDWSEGDDRDEVERLNIITILPTYIPLKNGDPSAITIQLENPDGTTYDTCSEVIPPASNYNCGAGGMLGLCSPVEPWSDGGAACAGTGANCCYMYNPGNRALVIAHTRAIRDDAVTNFGDNGNILSARITFAAPGTLLWEQTYGNLAASNNTTAAFAQRRSATPGNALYYLDRLAKLEYLGIPQMTYEPLYCNDNYQKLVPGIFLEETSAGDPIVTMNDFNSNNVSFLDTLNSTTPFAEDTAGGAVDADSILAARVTTQEFVDHREIFSDNQFMCCLELGTETADFSQCCSGFGVELDSGIGDDEDPIYTCKIPSGTNLNVYFNKFVSGEGINITNENVSALEEDDFDSYTGEPVTSEAVIQKLQGLGQEFCASGITTRGGAFGNFQARPFGPLREPVQSDVGDTLFTIINSIFDNGAINDRQVGFGVYNAGFRWNHHTYCQ